MYMQSDKEGGDHAHSQNTHTFVLVFGKRHNRKLEGKAETCSSPHQINAMQVATNGVKVKESNPTHKSAQQKVGVLVEAIWKVNMIKCIW